MQQKCTKGYLDLKLDAQPGLPEPVGGLLAASYRRAAPALAARTRTASPPRPSVSAAISSELQ